jgi:very-short-patch-repair endonuclease
MEITMPKGIYERNETHREIQSMGGKAAASKEALTCPRCGKVGKGNGMVGHIRLQLDCNVERLCARDGCGKVLKKDKRSNYCSIHCHKLDLYKDEEKRKELSEINKRSASRPEVRETKSQAMKDLMQAGAYNNFMTPGELSVKKYLETLGFKHNTIIRPGSPRLDFYHRELKINIEIDGESHSTPAAQERDRKRDALLLQEYGVKVVRIPDNGLTLQTLESALRNSNLELHMAKGYSTWPPNLRMQQRP